MKKYEHILYSAIGLVALFLALVAGNYLLSRVPAKLDLTEGRLYTLSPGTKRILARLQAPVRIKIYASRGEAMPLPLRGFAQRVVDLAEEIKRESNGKVVVERLDPKPDSEVEDAAQLDGIEPQQLSSGESFYLGVAVTQLDRKQTLGALSLQREPLLEYDLVRAIALVGQPGKPKVGVMAGLPVLGEKFNPFTRQASEPWVLANELKREYDVKPVAMTAKEIDPDIKVLLVIHPQGIPPQAEYALDQFVLRGGKLVAFVDPYAFFDQGMPGMPSEPSSSTLPTLFKAWGIGMATDKVVSDLVFGSGSGERYTPTVLSLNRTALDRNDVVTGSVETLLYAFGGAFTYLSGDKPAQGLSATELIKSSRNSMLVPNASATKSGDAATSDFKASGKSLPLALRLDGKFRTAFPDGPPQEKDAKDKKTPAPAASASPQLKESAQANSVVLVADVDMLADGAAVDVQDVFGQKVVVPSNGNLALALGFVEQLSAGDDLISLRSRAASFRPLTVLRELEAQAQQQYFAQIQKLEANLQQTTSKLQALQKSQGAKTGIVTPEQQAEIERFRKTVAETRLQLKEVRKQLRQDAEALVFWTKVANIALMPILVALAGLIVAAVRRRRTSARP